MHALPPAHVARYVTAQQLPALRERFDVEILVACQRAKQSTRAPLPPYLLVLSSLAISPMSMADS